MFSWGFFETCRATNKNFIRSLSFKPVRTELIIKCPFSLSCRLRTHPTSCASGIHSLQKICFIISKIRKQKQQNISTTQAEEGEKNSFLFELVLKRGMEFCLKEPFTDWPTCWTTTLPSELDCFMSTWGRRSRRGVNELRPVIGCLHCVRPRSDDARRRVCGAESAVFHFI